MKVETYKCDVCGVEKKEVNHWWLFFLTVPSQKWFAVKAWKDEEAGAAHAHLCGAACVITQVSEFLSK